MRRSGMSRRNFLRNAGIGAAALGAGALGMSGAVHAADASSRVKIGIMTSFGSWDYAYPPYGDCARDVVKYAIENSQYSAGVQVVLPSVGTCGYSSNGIEVFNELKSLGANFIVGVTCSSTLQRLFENPDLNAWSTTCMINPGANSDSIEDCWVGSLDRLPRTPFRSTTTPTSATSECLGADILASVPNPKVAVFTGPDSAGTSVDGYATGLTKGVILGVGSGNVVYSNAPTGCDDFGELLVTKEEFKAAMLAAYNNGANVFVLVPFANDDYAAAMVAAYQEANMAGTYLYGSASFSSEGPSGMRYVGAGFDESLMNNLGGWTAYVEGIKNATFMANYSRYPPSMGIPPGAYPADNKLGWANNAIDAFRATWPDDHYLLAHVDSGVILAMLAATTSGNVDNANKALMKDTFSGFMGSYNWKDKNSFATYGMPVFSVVVKDY
jgi:hypothetical protein